MKITIPILFSVLLFYFLGSVALIQEDATRFLDVKIRNYSGRQIRIYAVMPNFIGPRDIILLGNNHKTSFTSIGLKGFFIFDEKTGEKFVIPRKTGSYTIAKITIIEVDFRHYQVPVLLLKLKDRKGKSHTVHVGAHNE